MGTLYRRGDGRWAADWYDDADKRHTVTAKTPEEALSKRTEATGGSSSDQRLDNYLRWWLNTYLQRRIEDGHFRRSTWIRYERDVRNHVIPHLGHHTLDSLAPRHVEDMLSGMDTGPRGRQTTLRTLSSALTTAMRRELVDRNVAKLVEGPRVRSARPEVWDRGQFYQFLGGAQEAGDWLHGNMWLVQLGAALRPGEVLALRVRDCTDNTIRVHRSITWLPGAHYTFGPTKTGDDTVLALPEFARRALARALESAHGELLFSDRGTPLRQTSIGKPLAKLCKLAGVPRVTPHGLRHNTASALLAAGVPLEAVSHLLRHRSSRITTTFYSHLAEDTREQFVSALDRL